VPTGTRPSNKSRNKPINLPEQKFRNRLFFFVSGIVTLLAIVFIPCSISFAQERINKSSIKFMKGKP